MTWNCLSPQCAKRTGTHNRVTPDRVSDRVWALEFRVKGRVKFMVRIRVRDPCMTLLALHVLQLAVCWFYRMMTVNLII